LQISNSSPSPGSAGFVYQKSSTEQVGISPTMVFASIRKLGNESNKETLAKKHTRD